MDKSWKVGQVKFFDHDKGFGFLECWDDGEDYFVHISKVTTEPIEEYDYVVFKLGPSRKKPGSFEAINLSLVSKFSKDYLFLKEQFSKYSDKNFRKSIVQSLPTNEILKLLEKEITLFEIIDCEEHFSKFIQTTTFYTSLNSNETLISGIDSTISAWIDQVASEEYKIKLWRDGLFQNQPEDEVLKTYFKNNDNKERLNIFNLIDTSSKTKLIEQYMSEGEPQEVLDFVLEHLKQINQLGYYADIKSKLFDTEYWDNKVGYDIYESVVQHLQLTIDDKEKISLFLNGYLNSISSELIIEKCCDLSREEIEKILERGLLKKTEVFKIINKLLAEEIEFFLGPPEAEFAMTLSDSDWDEYNEYQVEPFKWILKISGHLTKTRYAKVQDIIIKELPEWTHVSLWENNSLAQIPSSSISRHLFITEELQSDIEMWLSNGKIEKEDIIGILKSNIQSQEEIKNRQDYYVLNNHLQSLIHLDVDVIKLKNIIPKSNLWFYKLSLWVEGIAAEFNYDEYKTKLVFLSPDHQIRFIKKLFWLADTNKFDLTVEKLSQLTRIDFDIYKINENFYPDIPLDISVDIVIEAIKSYSENESFLLDGELLKIVFKDLTFNEKYKFQIRELFEKCIGRYEADYDWETEGNVRKVPFGNNQFYFAINIPLGKQVHIWTRQGGYDKFEKNRNFEKLKEAVKELPGRKWNPKAEHWGVPSQYEEEVMQFARENRFFINIEGSNYANNTHLAEMKRTKVPNGITFCEGRLAKKKHQTFNQEFWWCTNKACLSNCESLHQSENWNEYTLLDFLTILGFNLDDGNRVGDYIEKGKYYQFISSINRFNRLLDRMYCDDCEHILYPVEDSHFAHHRVVRFHCANKDCSEFHKEIYLHHCLNGKCNGIIDSRKSKKCPNGLYICSNNECGCCCSHNMMQRRLNNLVTTGGHIHPKLKKAVENKLGHLERAEHFCYKCGKLTDEIDKDIFRCQDCSIQYDVSDNNFKRPHIHLRQNQGIQIKNLPPDDFNEDDFYL